MGEMYDEEITQFLSALYYAGWIEKNKYPEVSRNHEMYEAVQERLKKLGVELVDKSYSPWYVIRLFRENDRFSEFHRFHKNMSNRHLALLLILYTKLLLPIRIGQVDSKETLKVSFNEIFQMYGEKFKTGRRRLANEASVKALFTFLCNLNYIIKPYGEDCYVAGPLMYALSDDILADLAEESYKVLYDISDEVEEDAQDKEV